MKNHKSLDELRQQLASEYEKEREINERVRGVKSSKEATIRAVAGRFVEILQNDINELKTLFPLRTPIDVNLPGSPEEHNFISMELLKTSSIIGNPTTQVKFTRSDTNQVIILQDVSIDEISKIITKKDLFIDYFGENGNKVTEVTGLEFLYDIKKYMNSFLEGALLDKIDCTKSNTEQLYEENDKINKELGSIIQMKNKLMSFDSSLQLGDEPVVKEDEEPDYIKD